MTEMGAIAANRRVGIVLNGQPFETVACSLAELVAGEQLEGQRIATALNGRFVPAAERATTELGPGDRVEIVSPRQGG